MQQLADMRQSASSLQKRVARLTGDVHPRMLTQVRTDSVCSPLLHAGSAMCSYKTNLRRQGFACMILAHHSHWAYAQRSQRFC